MSAAHTPGPWSIEVAADGLNKWISCGRYTVATVAQLPNQVNIGEADANAALFKAAPELLQKLRALTRSADYWLQFLDPKDRAEFANDIAAAQAAIAEATGSHQ